MLTVWCPAMFSLCTFAGIPLWFVFKVIDLMSSVCTTVHLFLLFWEWALQRCSCLKVSASSEVLLPCDFRSHISSSVLAWNVVRTNTFHSISLLIFPPEPFFSRRGGSKTAGSKTKICPLARRIASSTWRTATTKSGTVDRRRPWSSSSRVMKTRLLTCFRMCSISFHPRLANPTIRPRYYWDKPNSWPKLAQQLRCFYWVFIGSKNPSVGYWPVVIGLCQPCSQGFFFGAKIS